MAYDSILVHIDGTDSSAPREALAARLAVSHACPLIGLYLDLTPPPVVFHRTEDGHRHATVALGLRQMRREEARNAFLARGTDLPVEWRMAGSEEEGLREVREAGLVVAGQYRIEADNGVHARQWIEALLFESGRPILVMPYAGSFDSVGKRAILAWSGSRESARALHDAAPLLEASQVRVLCARTPAGAAATPAEHAVRVLERHAAHAEVEHAPGGEDITIGEMILSRACDIDADLIVMGAYGHSRMREMVLGGVTRTIIESMTVPVLFSR